MLKLVGIRVLIMNYHIFLCMIAFRKIFFYAPLRLSLEHKVSYVQLRMSLGKGNKDLIIQLGQFSEIVSYTRVFIEKKTSCCYAYYSHLFISSFHSLKLMKI